MVRLRRFWASRLSIPFCGNGTAALSCLGGRKGLVGPHVAGGDDDEDDEGALAVDIHRSTFVFLVVDPQAIDAVDQADIALPSSSDSSTCSSVCFRSAASACYCYCFYNTCLGRAN